MKRAEELARDVVSKATQSKQYTQQQPGCESNTELQAVERTIRIWDRMVELYSDKWTRRNGLTPPSLWINAIGKLSDSQVKSAIGECMRQCLVEGNRFAPDLSDFLTYVSMSNRNGFGLEVQDVMDEFRRYCRDRYLHSCAETFPWRQPVLYWICCDMRSEMNQRNLTTPELEKRAAHHLKTWAQKVDRGEAVPIPVPLLSEKPRAKAQSGPGPGHVAAMAMLSRIRSKNQI